jgi:hypothetical protein
MNSSSDSQSYFGYEQYEGTWHDAEKNLSNPEDDFLCWAAAASNILMWTGWGTPPDGRNFADEHAVFQYFQNHWANQTGYPQNAWRWWFDGIHQSGVDVDGGGFWYPPYSFQDYYHVEGNRAKAMLATAIFLHRGFGVVLELMKIDFGSHYVSCWGYKYDVQDNYIGIYLTDSDDISQELRCYEVAQNGAYPLWWYIQEIYGKEGYFIAHVHALDRFPKAPSPPSGLRIRP